MDRYEKVTLEKNDNRCDRAEISILITNRVISSGKGDLHVHIKEMHTHMREIELKEEEELK
jgi:hypothetical protein